LQPGQPEAQRKVQHSKHIILAVAVHHIRAALLLQSVWRQQQQHQQQHVM
jgi:hypothetical protein